MITDRDLDAQFGPQTTKNFVASDGVILQNVDGGLAIANSRMGTQVRLLDFDIQFVEIINPAEIAAASATVSQPHSFPVPKPQIHIVFKHKKNGQIHPAMLQMMMGRYFDWETIGTELVNVASLEAEG